MPSGEDFKAHSVGENGLGYRVQLLERWRDEIESLRPDVQAEVVRRLERKVDTLTKIAMTVLITLLTGLVSIVAILITSVR